MDWGGDEDRLESISERRRFAERRSKIDTRAEKIAPKFVFEDGDWIEESQMESFYDRYLRVVKGHFVHDLATTVATRGATVYAKFAGRPKPEIELCHLDFVAYFVNVTLVDGIIKWRN